MQFIKVCSEELIVIMEQLELMRYNSPFTPKAVLNCNHAGMGRHGGFWKLREREARCYGYWVSAEVPVHGASEETGGRGAAL